MLSYIVNCTLEISHDIETNIHLIHWSSRLHCKSSGKKKCTKEEWSLLKKCSHSSWNELSFSFTLSIFLSSCPKTLFFFILDFAQPFSVQSVAIQKQPKSCSRFVQAISAWFRICFQEETTLSVFLPSISYLLSQVIFPNSPLSQARRNRKLFTRMFVIGSMASERAIPGVHSFQISFRNLSLCFLEKDIVCMNDKIITIV